MDWDSIRTVRPLIPADERALGPNGSATDPNCQLGQLIGTIAGTGTWHCLGKSASSVANGTGDLILAVKSWPCCYSDNLGDFEVLTLAP